MAADDHASRAVRIGAASVVVRSNDRDVIGQIDHLFGAFADGHVDDAIVATIHVDDEGITDFWGNRRPDYRARFGGERIERQDLQPILLRLTRAMNVWMAESRPDHLHLHSGGVVLDGTGTAVLGASGSGKSTLVAALVAQGAVLVTDELLAIDPATLLVDPYPRPVTLRVAVWPAFGLPATEFEQTGTAMRREVAPSDLGDATTEPVRLTRAICVDRDPSIDRPIVSGPHSYAATAMALVDHSLGITVDEHLGLDTIVRLAVQLESYHLAYHDPFDAVPLVRDLPPPRHRDGHVTRIGHPDPSDRSVVAAAPGSTTWRFDDDSCLVGSPEHGCTALEPEWWPLWSMLLAGCPREDFAAALSGEELTAIDAWLRTMAEQGLVTGWPDDPAELRAAEAARPPR